MLAKARSALIVLALVLLLGGTAMVGRMWWDSRLPGTYSVMDHGSLDGGGGDLAGHDHGSAQPIDLTELREAPGGPDARFTLTARQADVRLPGGPLVHALTFDGRLPGPELRVQQGDLVEVTLRNEDIRGGVTIHWHVHAVLPGHRYRYRFRAKQLGTFWYHTHQAAAKDVRRGLFGAFVIEPARRASKALDLVLLSHLFSGTPTLNAVAGTGRRAVKPGTAVRLRLVNTDSTSQRFTLTGTPFRVVAVDGNDLSGPTPLTDTPLELGAGGRYDLAFTMPARPVGLSTASGHATLALSPDGTGDPPPPVRGPDFDPLVYGTPAPTPFDAKTRFDRSFAMDITRKIGFFDGRPGKHWAINGRIFPDVPVFAVERGDLVKVTIANRSGALHPMHLHGHHVLVLSRNRVAATGSPWWSDSLNVAAGDRYEVAFLANNPGIWMAHCHNLPHAAEGLTMHLAYAGVRTPFRIGTRVDNRPE